MDMKKLFLLFIFISIHSAVSSPSRVKRMIGGKRADIRDYPYLVFVGNSYIICSGAIISRHHVLTAAHCVIKQSVIEIRAGSSVNYKGGSLHQLETVTMHEKFSVDAKGLKSFYDIAVVRVKEPFNYGDTRQPIQLFGPGEEIKPASKAQGAGWGKTEHEFPTQIHKLNFFLVDKKSCNETVKSWGTSGLEEGQFCAMNGNPDKYFCYGDSGSPLVVGHKLAGITIYGGKCETKDSVGVYTEVSHFRDWIDQYVTYDEPARYYGSHEF